MRFYIQIRHPEWLRASTPQKFIDLVNRGLAPEQIAGWMIVVGCKHPLRAVYGSDLRAALALFYQATIGKLRESFDYQWWRIRHPEEVRQIDADIDQAIADGSLPAKRARGKER